jgi:DNA polymerase I-like protein with 3'-5' exonuclease and polymerase domains
VDKALSKSDWAALVLTEEQLKYASDDVRYLLALRARLAELLAAARLAHVFELEMRLILVVSRMEARGFSVDAERLRELRIAAAQEAGPIAGQLRSGLGKPHLNLESPSQLVAAFNAAGVEIAGTDDDTLAARPEPPVQLLRVYRKPASLAGYAGTLLAAQREGRIHAAYSSTGTVNGRFTCENPNLQNVPRNRETRSCFVPSAPDRRLIVADYGQIELRIAALIAEEGVMIKAFRSGEDLHRAISAACLRKPVGDVTPAERKLGKAVNFGFLYGQGAEGFQVYARSQYGVEISLGEARRFRDEFFRAYPAIRRWHDKSWTRAKDGVNVERTVFGRIVQARPAKGALEVTDWNRFNMLTEYRVCGSAADLLKVAMVRIDTAMPGDVHIVATVHDELILDAPVETAAFCLGMIEREMKGAFVEMFGTEVPVEVESKVCANWGEKE